MKKLIPFALVFTLAGCARADKKLDKQVAQEPTIQDSAQLRSEADQLIQDDHSITPEQRAELLGLRASLAPKLTEIEKHELRLRKVLVEELLSPSYSADEVSMIKKRLSVLEDQRLSLTFQSVDKANAILGHDEAHTHESVLRSMLNERVQGVEHGIE